MFKGRVLVGLEYILNMSTKKGPKHLDWYQPAFGFRGSLAYDKSKCKMRYRAHFIFVVINFFLYEMMKNVFKADLVSNVMADKSMRAQGESARTTYHRVFVELSE